MMIPSIRVCGCLFVCVVCVGPRLCLWLCLSVRACNRLANYDFVEVIRNRTRSIIVHMYKGKRDHTEKRRFFIANQKNRTLPKSNIGGMPGACLQQARNSPFCYQ